jgi:CMP-N-acetylneuraminic acid synthetase
MIPAIILGRKNSKGFPGKNTYPVLGKPMCYYPMKAALESTSVTEVFLSTDDEKLMEIAKSMGVNVIVRPPHLAEDRALGEDAYQHAYYEIVRSTGRTPDIAVLLFCNAPTVTSKTIDQGVSMLLSDPEADSAVTTSKYNMWSPLRARRLNENGYMDPFVSFEYFGDPNVLNCDRDSQGDVLYADMGCSVVKCQNLINLSDGLLPQKWMGKKILPILQEAGCDVDFEWQIPMVEWWLQKYADVSRAPQAQ